MKKGKDGTQKKQFCFKNSKLNIWHTDTEWWSYFKCRPLQLFHSDEGLMLRTSVPKLITTANLHYKLVTETKLSYYNLVCYWTHNWRVQVFFMSLLKDFNSSFFFCINLNLWWLIIDQELLVISDRQGKCQLNPCAAMSSRQMEIKETCIFLLKTTHKSPKEPFSVHFTTLSLKIDSNNFTHFTSKV